MAKATGAEKRKMYKGWAVLSGEAAKAEKARINKRREDAAKNSGGKLTNASFAATDTEFKECCELAGVPATSRQASKWFRKEGLAYKVGRPERERLIRSEKIA
jgi:hypothetical protein